VLNTISTYLAPLLVFGLVVFVHELGHFLAAKLTGVYAPVFSLGWGSRLFGIRRGETDYRVSMFPIGGFVRMATREDDSMAGIEGGRDRGELTGEPEAPPAPSALWDDHSMAPFGPKAVPQNRWVESKSTSARVFIMSAGVLMNIVLTLIVSSGVFYHYGTPYIPAVIDSVATGMPAAGAGFAHGDQIVAVNGEPVKSWSEVVDRIAPVTTGSLTIEVKRGSERISRTLTPQVAEIVDTITGARQQVGKVGIQVMADSIARTKISLGKAMVSGSRATWGMATSVTDVLLGLVKGQISPKNLGGPIAIARTSVQAAKSGGEMLWSLIAFLSLNIAILNLVPIPVLDGGQILLVLAERVKGSAFSANAREGFAKVGVFAVLGLFLLVMFNDVKALIVN
jgi:regulator of sigma E protease